MDNLNNIKELFPVLKKIAPKRVKEIEECFRTAPDWLLKSITLIRLDEGENLVCEGQDVEYIYFVAEGTIKATDFRIYGIAYDFMLFTRLYAIGGMEVIMDQNKYQTTLQTLTKCIVLKIPKSKYKKWIRSDIQALEAESKRMGEYLLEQARNSRAYLFLEGTDRLALLFTERYEKYAKDGVMEISSDRQYLSDFTGLSVRTITRSLQKLLQDNLVTKKAKLLVINNEQYKQLKEIVSKVLAADELN